MILGLRTVAYPVPDLAAAKTWYAKVLEVEPYFDEPFYVGFNVGGFELGLIPDGTPSVHGTQVYWGVTDVPTESTRLIALGAKPDGEPQDVGGGIIVAKFHDPFGNMFAIIANPHFDPKAVK